MDRARKSNFAFYLFWASLLLFGSIVAVFIFYKANPAFVEQLLTSRGRIFKPIPQTEKTYDIDSSKNKKTSPNTQESQSNSLSKKEQNLKEQRTEEIKEQAKKGSLETQKSPPYIGDPLFKTAILDKTSFFKTEDGRVYSAGSMVVQGFYPDDFNGSPEHSGNLYSAVSITLTVGWKNLPSFSQIQRSSNTPNTKTIVIPSLQILSMKTHFTDPIAQRQEANNKIEEYIKQVFLDKKVPPTIVSLTQQRLAASYIQKGYQNIILRSQ